MSFGGTKDRLVFLREIGLDELGMGDEFGKRGHIPNSSKVFILGEPPTPQSQSTQIKQTHQHHNVLCRSEYKAAPMR